MNSHLIPLDPAVWVDKQKTDWYSILTIPHHSMRTLYLGNLSSDTTIEDILSSIRGGIVEQIKLFPERSCAFVTFLDPAVSTAIYSEAQTRRIMINGNDIKVGWGKQSSPSPSLLQAVHNGASRNVFIGNTDELVTEPFLHRELSKFGAIDQIKIIPDKRIAFVHMCSISTAMKVVATLPLDPKWVTYRLNYGKDRCAHNSKIVPSLTIPVIPPVLSSHFPSNINVPNRTVYLGGIPTEVTVKDLCDMIRGGNLQNIKYMPDRNIAFVTFLEHLAALSFYQRLSNDPMIIYNKKIKVGWGKATPIPPAVMHLVQSVGATRNVYLGSIDVSLLSEERLMADFSPFGEIELINLVSDKNIGFINFTDILSAIRAVENMKSHPEYSKYKINYGKDRCGHPIKYQDYETGSDGTVVEQ